MHMPSQMINPLESLTAETTCVRSLLRGFALLTKVGMGAHSRSVKTLYRFALSFLAMNIINRVVLRCDNARIAF